MNYFDFYEIPLRFNPNQEVIKQKFYAFSKKFHPDFYANESSEKQEEVLELSTLNNKAYQVLKDAEKRLHYLLVQKGQLAEGENYALPQDFLMEMMEVNEQVMDLQFDPDPAKLAKLKSEILELENALQAKLNNLTEIYDQQAERGEEGTLVEIKDLYFRNKYLLRIKEGILKIR